MVVGLRLPEWRTRTSQDQIRFACCDAFQSSHQTGRRDAWEQECVDMIAHKHVGSQVVMAQFNALVE